MGGTSIGTGTAPGRGTDTSTALSHSSVRYRNSTAFTGGTAGTHSSPSQLLTGASSLFGTGNIPLTIAPSVVASEEGSQLVVGSSTIMPGGPALTIGSNTISLGASGILNVDGSTSSLSFIATATTGDYITATITTFPPDMSTQSVPSGTSYGNTWLTTSHGGQHTTAAVVNNTIIWFPHAWHLHTRYIWNIHGLHLRFHFPGIPCIKIHTPLIDIPLTPGCSSSGSPNPVSDNLDPPSGEDGDDPEPKTQTDTESNSCTHTATETCRTTCPVKPTGTADSSYTYSCYTTTCYTPPNSCSKYATTHVTVSTNTSTATSTSSVALCNLAYTPYDMVATYSSLGMALPLGYAAMLSAVTAAPTQEATLLPAESGSGQVSGSLQGIGTIASTGTGGAISTGGQGYNSTITSVGGTAGSSGAATGVASILASILGDTSATATASSTQAAPTSCILDMCVSPCHRQGSIWLIPLRRTVPHGALETDCLCNGAELWVTSQQITDGTTYVVCPPTSSPSVVLTISPPTSTIAITSAPSTTTTASSATPTATSVVAFWFDRHINEAVGSSTDYWAFWAYDESSLPDLCSDAPQYSKVTEDEQNLDLTSFDCCKLPVPHVNSAKDSLFILGDLPGGQTSCQYTYQGTGGGTLLCAAGLSEPIACGGDAPAPTSYPQTKCGDL